MQFGNVLTFKLRMPDDPAIPFIELYPAMGDQLN